jgi:hypothetical protein
MKLTPRSEFNLTGTLGRHPCDVLLLLAAQESDAPKVAELLESGADINVTVCPRLGVY